MDNTAQEYINKMRETGKSDDEIKQAMMSAGWDEKDIPIGNNHKSKTVQIDNDSSKELNYRLFKIGKILLITSPIIYIVLLFISFTAIHSFYISSFIVITGWIITIPSAVSYKRITKKDIGKLSWLIIFLPIIVGIIFYNIYIYLKDFSFGF